MLSAIMSTTINFYYLYPLPDLPPGGKEHQVRPFPLGGNGKGGYIE